MGKLVSRGETLARAAQVRRIQGICDRLKEVVRGVAIGTDEARVIVSGRGLLKRWLSDPALRFLSRDAR